MPASQGRQAEGAPAQHRRRRQVQGDGPGGRGRRQRDHRARLEVNGRPKIDLSGREGVLSAKTTAGGRRSFDRLRIRATRRPRTSLSGDPTGWKVVFDPKSVDKIAPNEMKEVQATISPPEKAVAGDYQATLRANWRGDSAASTFRVTVATSSMWGIVGIGIIGAALLVLVGAVARFGRR